MINEEQRHHRKCLSRYGDVCNCSEIYTPPTIPRYQRQLMEKAKKRNSDDTIEFIRNMDKLAIKKQKDEIERLNESINLLIEAGDWMAKCHFDLYWIMNAESTSRHEPSSITKWEEAKKALKR